MQVRVDRSNAMAQHALEILECISSNWGFAVVNHPLYSWLWEFPLAHTLLARNMCPLLSFGIAAMEANDEQALR